MTKDSGDAGGFPAKAQAAFSLGIPLIVVERPLMEYPNVVYDAGTIVEQVRQLLSAGAIEKGEGSIQDSGVRSSGLTE